MARAPRRWILDKGRHRLASVGRKGGDIDKPDDLGILAGFRDDCSAVGMANKNHGAALRGDRTLGCGDIVRQRYRRILVGGTVSLTRDPGHHENTRKTPRSGSWTSGQAGPLVALYAHPAQTQLDSHRREILLRRGQCTALRRGRGSVLLNDADTMRIHEKCRLVSPSASPRRGRQEARSVGWAPGIRTRTRAVAGYHYLSKKPLSHLIALYAHQL